MGSGISEAKGSWDSLFGKKDPNATNDMLGGQAVATGTPGAKTVADPNQGLSDAQARNRKLGKTFGGAIAGMAQPGQPQAGGQQPPINFAPPQQDYSAYFQGKRSPFFG